MGSKGNGVKDNGVKSLILYQSSFPRKRESRVIHTPFVIPAKAGIQKYDWVILIYIYYIFTQEEVCFFCIDFIFCFVI